MTLTKRYPFLQLICAQVLIVLAFFQKEKFFGVDDLYSVDRIFVHNSCIHIECDLATYYNFYGIPFIVIT